MEKFARSVEFAQCFHGEESRLLDGRHPFFGNAECGESLRLIALSHLFGAHLREEEHVLNVAVSGHEHHESVDTDTDTAGGWHAILQGAQKVVVNNHRLIVALIGKSHLFHKSFFLVDRVVEFAVGICQFLAIHHQFKSLREPRFAPVFFGERRHFHGVVGDERGLHESAFAKFAEYFVDEFALAHGVVDFHVERAAHLANFVFALIVEVVAGFFFDGIEYGQTAVRCLKADGFAIHHSFRASIHSHANFFEQLLRETHHPIVVFVLHIEFHASKFRVVVSVHTLVAEVFANFVHAFKSAHYQPLQIEFGGDTHIHGNVECIEMGDKRARACTAGNGLQGGCFHFGVAGFVEHLAHGFHNGGAFQERIFHAIIHNEVDVSLTIAQFRVVESIVGNAIFHLHDRQRFQALAQHGKRACMYTDFAGLCTEHKSCDAHKVANVEQFFKHLVVERFIFVGTNFIAVDIHLDAPFRVLQFHKRSLAHDASAHHATCHAHLARLTVGIAEVGFGFVAPCVDHKFISRVGLYAQFTQTAQTVASHNFLFA